MSRLLQIRILWTVGLALVLLLGWVWSVSPSGHVSTLRTDVDLGAVIATETNWPQLRGPTSDAFSVETGLAESWPEVGPPVVWTRELGQGYSSFAAVGNRVFTQTQSLYQQSVVCLDAGTGDTVWAYNYGWPYDGGGLYPGPRSTPTWHDGYLYFAAPDGTIACLDGANGKLRWSCNPKKNHRGRGTDFGYACSPVIIDGRVIVPVGGLDASVVALDARDGSTIWKSGDASASYATPLSILWRGRSFVVTPLENTIAAFDVETGKQQWEIEFSEGYDEHSAAPIYREPFLFVASPFKAGAKRFRLVDDDGASVNDVKLGKPVISWETPKFSNDVASSVLVDGRIYGFDLKDPQSRLDRPSRGEFRCLDFETGRIIWSTDKVGQANLIVADQKLILFTDRGELILARSGTDEYTEIARTQVFRDEICWTYPALHHGCVFLRTQTRAACLYLGKTPYETRRPVRLVKDIPRGRALNATWLIGGEREFPATVPDWNEFRTWYAWSLGGLALASVAALLSLTIAKSFRWLKHSIFPDRGSVAQEPPDPSETIGSVSTRDGIEAPWPTLPASELLPIESLPAPDLLLVASDNQNKGTDVSTSVSRSVFWMTAILAGAIGSPLINSRQSDYVLLWPLSLWSAFQMTINIITWTERHSDRRRIRWLSRGCGMLFVGTCLLYFHLCRSLGYAIEWSFLVGFLPAFAVAALAARFMTTRMRFWPMTDLAFSAFSFSAYFWFSVIFIKWKLVVGS